jgi:hypothetical protein
MHHTLRRTDRTQSTTMSSSARRWHRAKPSRFAGRSMRTRVCVQAFIVVSVIAVTLFGYVPGVQADTSEAAQLDGGCNLVVPCCSLGVQTPRVNGDFVDTSLRWDCNYIPRNVEPDLVLWRNGRIVSSRAQRIGDDGHHSMAVFDICIPDSSWRANANVLYTNWWGQVSFFETSSELRSLACTPPRPPPGPPPCPPNLPNCREQ